MIGHVELAGLGHLDVLRTKAGDQIGVLTGRQRCWIVVYDRTDPDAALVAVEMNGDEAGQLVGMLNDAGATGASGPDVVVVGSVTEALNELANA